MKDEMERLRRRLVRPAEFSRCMQVIAASGGKLMGGRPMEPTARPALLQDERGLSTVEYVIILVLIAAAAISLWSSFGDTLTRKIDETNDVFDSEVVIRQKKK
jgi:Flp pilus assembly pilin Flp